MLWQLPCWNSLAAWPPLWVVTNQICMTCEASGYINSHSILPIHIYRAQEPSGVLVIETSGYLDTWVNARESLLGHIFNVVECHVNDIHVEIMCVCLVSIVLTHLYLHYVGYQHPWYYISDDTCLLFHAAQICSWAVSMKLWRSGMWKLSSWHELRYWWSLNESVMKWGQIKDTHRSDNVSAMGNYSWLCSHWSISKYIHS